MCKKYFFLSISALRARTMVPATHQFLLEASQYTVTMPVINTNSFYWYY